MNISTECYNYIESILGCKADLPLEDIISILSSIMVIKILSNIKFENIMFYFIYKSLRNQ